MWNRFLSVVEITLALGYCAYSGIWGRIASITGLLRYSMVDVKQLAKACKGVPYIALFILTSVPAFYLGYGSTGAFNSPDESAAYLAAQTLAEDGRLYLQGALTELRPPCQPAREGSRSTMDGVFLYTPLVIHWPSDWPISYSAGPPRFY